MYHNISLFLLKPKPTIDCSPQNIRRNSNIFPLGKINCVFLKIKNKNKNKRKIFSKTTLGLITNFLTWPLHDPMMQHLIKTPSNKNWMISNHGGSYILNWYNTFHGYKYHQFCRLVICVECSKKWYVNVIIDHTIIFIVGPQFLSMPQGQRNYWFLSNALKPEKLCCSRKTTLPQLQNSVNHRHSDPNDTEL